EDKFTLINTGSISRIDGGEGENTLTGRDENSTWEIDATNSLRFTYGDLYVTTFENINKLQGGSGADTFNIHTLDRIPTVVDGGAGAADHVDFTPLNPAVGLTVGVGDVSATTHL